MLHASSGRSGKQQQEKNPQNLAKAFFVEPCRSYFINSARPPNQQRPFCLEKLDDGMRGGGKRRDETATPTPLFTADGACEIGLTGQHPRVHPKIVERRSCDVKSKEAIYIRIINKR